MDVSIIEARLLGDEEDLLRSLDKSERALGDLEKEAGVAGEGASGHMDKMGSNIGATLGKMAGVLAAAFSVVEIVRWGSEGVKQANDLEGSLREVVTLTGAVGPAADANFSQFSGLVKDLSTELGVAQETLTGGLYQALSAGVPQDNALEFMRVASKASIAGVTDVETAVDGLSTVINAFGLDAADAQGVSDAMFSAVKGGKTTFEELSASLYNVGPSAAAAGIGFDEVAAALATMTSAGVPTAVATTQLRAAMVGLQRPSKDLDGIFQALGYSNAQTAIEAEGLGFALDAVNDAAGGNNGVLQTLLGSTEAVAAAQVIAGTGADKFAEEMARQADAAGATSAAFDEIDKSRNLERLATAGDNLKTGFGQALLPVINLVAGVLLDELFPVLEQGISWFQGLTGNLEGAGGGLDTLGKILSPVIGYVKEFGPIVFELATAFSPLKIILQALLPLLPQLGDVFKTIASVLGSTLQSVLPIVTDLVGKLVGVLSGVFAAALPVVVTLIDEAAGVFEQLLPIILALAGVIGDALGPILETAGGLLEQLLPIVGDLAGMLVNALVPIFIAAGDAVEMLVPMIGDLITTALLLIEPILGLVEALMPLVEVVLGLIVDALGPLLDLFIAILDPILAVIELIIQILVPIIEALVVAVGWIVDAIVLWIDIMTRVYSKVFEVLGAIGGKFRDLYDRYIAPVVSLIRAAIGAVVDTISSRFDTLKGILGVVGDTFRSVFQGVSDFVTTIFGTIVGVITGAINGIIGLVNGAIRALNKIHVDIPDIPGLPGRGTTFGISLPEIPLLAKGGTAMAGGLAIIGENGPELLKMNAGASVIPLPDGSGGSPVSVQVDVKVETKDFDADRFIAEVVPKIRFAMGG